ncbi:tetratricopeptide repeat protein [Parapedobacter indicus]|uniref:Tetratricopeptide repeat-containing protein n=1 Tax=Parapedobacter indicus TaxID=1477437 RepID=A0A1I3KV96_9SPHI|nr:tetratricopeptide repeat protein [Parapedobacter indicus]PPL01935.1 tetratricopeptide repeat protein [Parapedobacter indicus]SFI76449.1 Tetratricopeptide repeat-containing protein [Parapedobacter indicus]
MQQKTKQIVAVTSIVIVMGLLLAQPIKGLVNDDTTEATTSGSSSSTVTFESVSLQAKQGLNASILQEISTIESQLPDASGQEKIELLQQLATEWDDVNRPAPLGFVYEELAELDPKFDYWLKAGDAYRAAYTNLQDTTMVKALNGYAINAYQKALELNADDLDAKTGLGSAYVSGTNNPMAGIALLREVVEADPSHIGANKSLGLFSMQSRQFDRAIERFKTVISVQPDAESYFYLATSYENIGLKREAISAFEKSRDLAADPTLTQFINRKIDELSK